MDDQVTQICDAVLQKAKHFFGKNLLFFALVGSAGKNNYIAGWSDIDLLIVTKYFYEDQDVFQNLFNYSTHTGITILTQKEWYNLLVSQRILKYIDELNNGENIILYRSKNLSIPIVNHDLIFNNRDREIYSAIAKLKRLVVNRTNYREILKTIIYIQKLMLCTKKILVYQYSDLEKNFFINFKFRDKSFKSLINAYLNTTDLSLLKSYKNHFLKYLESIHW